MNIARTICSLFVGVSLAASTASAADMGTGFSYQGRLENPPGTAVDDTCDFRVGLWDADVGGNQKGLSPQTIVGVSVVAGIFTLGPPATSALDFGDYAIDGMASWLEIELKCTGDAGFVLLTPRVEMTPAPHALALPGMYTLQNATSPNVIGGYHGNSVPTGVVGATISGGGFMDDGMGSFETNHVTEDFGTISGGAGNRAGGTVGPTGLARFATVGGGSENTASGQYSTISGGQFNEAREPYSTVAGGIDNLAVGALSFIGGGSLNGASGYASTTPGGQFNSAIGDYSFAAGKGAQVVHDNSFIWNDHAGGFLYTTANNQFLIHASGGVGIGTNAPSSMVEIAAQDGLAITGFQPFMTLRDTNAANARTRIANAGGNFNFFPESFIGGNAAMVLTNSTGRLGIGTTAPGMSLEVATPSYYGKPTMGVADGSTGWAYLLADTVHHSLIWNSSTDMRFGTETSRGSGYAERLRLTGSGRLGIGDATPDAALDVVGDINYTGVIVDVSDERLKSDIQPLECALEKVARLRGISFTMKGSTDPREVGLIAQDVQQVLPEAVRVVDNENGYLGVSYPSVVSLLVEALKEIENEKDCEIRSLNEKLDSLESQLSELKATLAELHSKKGGN